MSSRTEPGLRTRSWNAVAYGTLANGGIHVPPRMILEIRAADGSVVWRATPVEGREAVSPQAAYSQACGSWRVDPLKAELGPRAWDRDVEDWLRRARRGPGVSGRHDSMTAYLPGEASWGGPLVGPCPKPKPEPEEEPNESPGPSDKPSKPPKTPKPPGPPDPPDD